MARTIDNPTTICNTSAADVAQDAAAYYDFKGCDQALFIVDITGTATVTLDFDLNGDGSIIMQEEFTSDDQKVLDDPAGRVRAWTNGVGGGEAAVVYMRRIYHHNR